jgi:hypothetical protein
MHARPLPGEDLQILKMADRGDQVINALIRQLSRHRGGEVRPG